MNAGGRHGEIGDLVRHVDVMEDDGTVRRLDREECGFRFKDRAPSRFFNLLRTSTCPR